MSNETRELALLMLGMGMGLGLHEIAHMAWDWLMDRRDARRQWFRPQSRSDARPGPGPAQHTTPRQIKGQRPSEGRHRPKQTQAHFSARVRRRIVKQPARVAAPSMRLTDESQGGDPTYD